jgi:uncharacterized repeat protein (TIGR01451 family)
VPDVGGAATYTVNKTSTAALFALADPSGMCTPIDCTFREAVAASNGSKGVLDTIVFDLEGPGGPQVVAGGLEATDPVVIDGGARTTAGVASLDCTQPRVEILAEFAPFQNPTYTLFGLKVSAGSTVRCLAIAGFRINLDLEGGGATVERNYIGLDANGNVPSSIGGLTLPTSVAGWGVTGIYSNVGGHLIVDNVIAGIGGVAGNGQMLPAMADLIFLEEGGNVIRGNRFGTTPDGTAAVRQAAFGSFGTTGMQLFGSDNVVGGLNTTPGGACTGDCNLISGVSSPLRARGSNLVVQGNFMGPDVTGMTVLAPLAVTVGGMSLEGVTNAWIGGSDPHERNVISINTRNSTTSGIAVDTGNNVFIRGNYFGTDTTGTRYLLPLNAAAPGISLDQATNVVIGGTNGAEPDRCSGDCNLLSAIRDSTGLPPNTRHVRIEGNYLGTDLIGVSKLGPGGRISLLHDARFGDVMVGGEDELQGNVIAFGGGVTVHGEGTRPPASSLFSGCPQPEPNCPGVIILSNRIFRNTGLGISLNSDPPGPLYPVANDALDADLGANDLQNFPEIDSVQVENGRTTVAGTFKGKAARLYRLQFFRNSACDESRFFGEGELLVEPINGSTDVETDGNGNTSFSYMFPFALGPNEAMTATATDFAGWWTSGFSQCLADVSITKSDVPDPVAVGASLTYTLVVQNSGPAPAYATEVIDTLPASVSVDGSPNASKGTCNVSATTPARVTCALGDLGRDETATITIRVRPTQPGVITNTSTVDWAGMRLFPAFSFDPATTNNSDSEQTTVTQGPQGGTIVLAKQTLPDGDPMTFTFSGDAAGTIGDGGTINKAVAPGRYSSTEVVPNGWDVASILCDDTDSTGNPSTAVATFNVAAGETVTCVFTDSKRGTVAIKKTTDPTATPGSFSFSGDLAGAIAAGGQLSRSNLPTTNDATYTATETDPAPTFDLASIVCDDNSSARPSTGTVTTRTAVFRLDPGETVTCTFTNRKRGSVTLKKTTNARVDPSKDINFLLSGPSLPAAGVSRSTFADPDGVLEWPNLAPAQYRMCEMPVPAGFTSFWNLDGVIVMPYNPDASLSPPEDLGTRCYDFGISPGQLRAFMVDNSRPGGDPRTIGYWKNWNRCTTGNQAATAQKNGGAASGFFLAEDLLPQLIGDIPVTGCQGAVRLLSKQDQNGKSKSSDAAYELGAQLLAARFNLAAGAETCAAVQQVVLDGQSLLDQVNFTGSGDYLGSKSKDPRRNQSLSLATALDRYNNGNLC